MLTGKLKNWGVCVMLSIIAPLVVAQDAHSGWAGEDPAARSGGCAFFTLTPNPTSPTCNGFNDGIASVIPSDGVGPYTYLWVGGPTTQSWNNVSAGTYTVIVFDQGQGGAPCNIDVFVNEPGPLTVFGMNAVSPTCFGACNGQAAPIVIGGNGGYSYSWDSGEAGFSAQQLCNPFTLTVIDAQGCVLDTTYVFANEPQDIIITANTVDISCTGEADGEINISVEGGIPDYTFNWSGPNGFSSDNAVISGIPVGTYIVVVTDSNGCEASASFEITEPDVLEAQATVTPNPCAGDSLGAITITTSGGTPEYTFLWSGPFGYSSVQQELDELISGTYDLELTDANGCVLNLSFEITAPPAIDITLIPQNISCTGANDGQIDASASGGTGDFEFQWTGPNGFASNLQNISGLSAGVYLLTVTDSEGCSNFNEAEIVAPEELEIEATITDISCNGANDGSIFVAVSGGMPGYEFNWTGPGGFNSINSAINNLVPGLYTVEVSDDNGCLTTADFTVSEPSTIQIDADITDNLCAGQEVGAIDLFLSGGTAPFTISWIGPDGFSSSDQNISNLGDGSYVVEVTDSSNCVQVELFVVSESNPIELELSPELLTCPDDSDGAIELSISGGTPDYFVNWSGPDGFASSNPNISGLSAGVYLVMVLDANGCEASDALEILAPDVMIPSADVFPASCTGADDGSATLFVSGGAPEYSYDWLGPAGYIAAGSSNQGLAPGEYIVTITDSNGCTEQIVFDIIEPNPIELEADIEDASCNGVLDGSIILTVNGGSAPYTYSWSGPFGFVSSNQNIFELNTGNYTVLVTDSEGCTTNTMFNVGFGEGPQIEAVVVNASCDSNDDGSIAAAISEGTPPYSIFWIGPSGFSANTVTISELAAGTYTLFVTDAGDCFSEASFTVNNPSDIEISGIVTDILCANESSGAIDVSITGPIGNITVAWSGPGGFTSTDLSIGNLIAGNYIFTVIDSLNCLVEQQFTVNAPEPLDLSFISSQPACGLPTGQVIASVSGGTVSNGYTYLWTDALNNIIGSSNQINTLASGTYTVTVSDDNGCTVLATVSLSESDIEIDAVVADILCNGDTDGAIAISIAGGIPPLNILWSGPNGFSSTDTNISNLAGGNYILTVTDSLGCASEEVFTVQEPELIQIEITTVNPLCADEGAGTIVTNISGGTPDYVYNWSGPDGFSSTDQNLTGLNPGTYLLEVADLVGCISADQADIQFPQPIAIEALVAPIVCFGDSSGIISISVSGGTTGYSISWIGPNGFVSNNPNLSGLFAGSYLLNLEDANLCSFDTIITLTTPTEIEVNATVNQINCFGQSTGEIAVEVNGGVPGYDIEWAGPDGFVSDSLTITNLSPGDYLLTVTDFAGCEVEATISITQPQEIIIIADVVNPECLQDNGSITVSVAGGIAPFTYTWEDNLGNLLGNDSSLTNLGSGLYVLTVSDSNNCEVSQTMNLVVPGGEISGDIADVSCFGGDNGAIATSVSGASEPIVYAWSAPNGFVANTPNVTGLPANTYTLIVTDSAGCVFIEVFEVTQPDSISIAAEVTGISCFGGDGAVSVVVSGGTPPFLYDWSGPNGFSSDTASLEGLLAGTYFLSVIDTQGCESSLSIQIEELPELEIEFDATDILCAGEASGILTALVSGGQPQYSYAWLGPEGFSSDSSTITGLIAGFYDIQVTDENGCVSTNGILLNEPVSLMLALTVVNATCGNSNGSAAVMVTGGASVGDYSYAWTDSDNTVLSSTNTAANLGSGIYTITVSDDNDCVTSEVFAISDGDGEILADIAMPTCSAGDDGAIVITVIGAAEPLEFNWIGPEGFTSNNQNITNLLPGTYVVEVIDSLGCVLIDIYVLDIPTTLLLSFEVTPVSCFGESDAGILINVDGGIPPYVIEWMGPDGFTSNEEEITDLAPGFYEVYVIDSILCSGYAQVTIVEPAEIAAEFEIFENLCADDINGAVTTVVAGGTAPYTFQWIGPNNFESASQNLGGLANGFYEVLITDSLGCTAQFDMTIGSSPEIELEVVQTSPNCYGEASGILSASVLGGAPSYSFEWSGPDGFISDTGTITDLIAGEYQLIVTDSLGCTSVFETELIQPDSLYADWINTPVSCNGLDDGQIEVNAIGGTSPYTYIWTGPDGFLASTASIFDLASGDYDLVYSDSLGCSGQLMISIGEPDSLTISLLNLLDALCSTDSSGAVSVDVFGGTPPYTYSWTGPDGFTSDDEDLTGLFPAEYMLTVTDLNGCEETLTATIDFTFEIGADAGLDIAVCENEQTELLIGTGTNSNEVWWTDSEGNVLSENDTLSVLELPGEYEFYFYASNGLCLDVDTVLVIVYALPNANAGAGQTIVEGEEVVLGGDPTSTTATDYWWSPNSTLSDSTAANPTDMPGQTTTYQVVVTDANGCVNNDFTVVVVVPDIYIPTGISPNGDGFNDGWIIDHIEQFPGNVVEVYNRWGDQLYRAQGYDNNKPWDGFYNGVELPVGTYYYVIELNDTRFPGPYTGPITIFR